MDDSNFFGVEQKIILFAGVFFASNGVVEIGALSYVGKNYSIVWKRRMVQMSGYSIYVKD